MAKIKLNKRYKYAGDIVKALLNRLQWTLEDVMEFMNSIEDADVAEVKHGYYEYDALEGQSYCSICESPKPSNSGDIRGSEVRHCYYCGAKMDGRSDT